ncbi:MAG: polysaccharide biosynthesis protein [Eubacteriales bacterium]|nr:polysaccharide biosynthesis protein [Eubacteriales bacterium]
MEKKSFVKGAAILAVAGLLVKLIGAVYRIPLNNIVGVEGMRYYDIVYRYYAGLLVISSSGLPTAISKMVSERVTLGDYKGAKQVFRTALLLLTGIGIVTFALMFFGADALASISYTEASYAEVAKQALSFRALAPSLFFVSVMCAYRGYLQGMQQMTGTAVSQVMEQIGKLAVGFICAMKMLPMGPEYGAMGALIGVSASELLALIVIYLFYMRRKRGLDRQVEKSLYTKKQLTFGQVTKKLFGIAIPVTIGASIMPITGVIDSMLIIRNLEGLGFSVDAAGEAYSLLYSYVTPIINMPAVLTVALAMSLVPAISAYMAKRDGKGVRRAAKTGMKLALMIGTPCSVGLFVLAKPILGMLYGTLTETQLVIASELMQTACIGVIFLSLVQTLTGVIQGLGKPVIPVVNLVFGGVLKVVTLTILMKQPNINIQGAAVSTVVCYASAAILDVIYLIRRTHMRVHIWDIFGKPIVSSVVMGGVVYGVSLLLQGHLDATVVTLLSVFLGVAAYGALVIALRMLGPSDIAFIPGGNKLGRLFGRRS